MTDLDYQTTSKVTHAVISDLRAAQALLRHDRAQALDTLNKLFRSGAPPKPHPGGRYAGKLIAIDLAPGFTQFFQWLTDRWMPWLGKTFHPTQASGENIFSRGSYPVARFFNPLYWGIVIENKDSYRAFAFRTYIAPGLADPDRMVLKIDYDLEENPSLTVRRVLDELVQLDQNLYLGKAHVRWWGRPASSWQTVAYFTLERK